MLVSAAAQPPSAPAKARAAASATAGLVILRRLRAGAPEGVASDVHDIVVANRDWMATTPVPKLFINGDPGALLTGALRQTARTWPHQREIRVPGCTSCPKTRPTRSAPPSPTGSPHSLTRPAADVKPPVPDDEFDSPLRLRRSSLAYILACRFKGMILSILGGQT